MKSIFKKLKHEKLTRAERQEIKINLLAFVVEHPLSAPEQTIFNLFSWPRYRYAVVVLVVIIIIALTGGTTYAAEQTLPGDFLYPVKIHVNEEIKAALTFSPEKKTEWEARRAERRLEEVERLAARGALKVEVRAQIEEQFVKHANRVQKRIKKFEEGGETVIAAKLNSRFETSLQTHERILERASDQIEGPINAPPIRIESEIKSRMLLQPILQRVRNEVNITTKAKIRVEEKIKLEFNKSKKNIPEIITEVTPNSSFLIKERNKNDRETDKETRKKPLTTSTRTATTTHMEPRQTVNATTTIARPAR